MSYLQPNTSSESLLFAEIEPFDSGWLQVSSQHHIYYEQCGNPQGVPVIFLHGGPGSGCTPKQRRFFDPAYYRVVLFDQRGCGRSLPLGGISENTTWHLVEDIEALRAKLGIEQWLVFGGSWGSTLALAYAANFLSRIRGMILRGIFLARPTELEWFIYRVGNFYPEVYAKFIHPIPENDRGNILAAYQKQIFSDETLVSFPAARTWNAYEGAIMNLLPEMPSTAPATPTADEILLARARVQLHYLINDCFLRERPLLAEIGRLRALPGVIIQGRYDMVCPPETAYSLHQAWPEAEFVMVPDAGHSAMERGITAALLDATETFKQIGH